MFYFCLSSQRLRYDLTDKFTQLRGDNGKDGEAPNLAGDWCIGSSDEEKLIWIDVLGFWCVERVTILSHCRICPIYTRSCTPNSEIGLGLLHFIQVNS